MAGGFRIHVLHSRGAALPRDPGSRRPALVLLHGAVISSNYYAGIVPALGRHFDVYAPDLPGQGRSDKPERALTVPQAAQAIVAWMDSAGITRAALVGHSLGCQASAHVAADHPERVSRLVLMGPTVAPAQRHAWSVTWRLALDGLRERKSLVLLELLDLLRTGVRRAWQVLRAALDDAIEETLPRVPQPTLVVRGTRDPLVPADWARRLASLLPHGALLEIPGSPHASHYTDAERTLAPIIAFLQADDPARDEEIAGAESPARARQVRGASILDEDAAP